mmetsp:Transcript_38089/g.81136  ORF Transcript_38089/g.81136 Transcript_38089/m.81136 type:complete len:228 (+) Transcript_38089:1326-2009(+)
MPRASRTSSPRSVACALPAPRPPVPVWRVKPPTTCCSRRRPMCTPSRRRSPVASVGRPTPLICSRSRRRTRPTRCRKCATCTTRWCRATTPLSRSMSRSCPFCARCSRPTDGMDTTSCARTCANLCPCARRTSRRPTSAASSCFQQRPSRCAPCTRQRPPSTCVLARSTRAVWPRSTATTRRCARMCCAIATGARSSPACRPCAKLRAPRPVTSCARARRELTRLCA